MPYQYQDTRDSQAMASTTTSNALQIFEHHAFGKVRVVEGPDGEPWFVAKDVCAILELRTKDIPDRLVRDEQKPLAVISGCLKDNNDLRRDTRIISESGLYGLILRSRKPQAKGFSKWVRSEVLPSIRKHGSYSIPTHDASPTSPFDAQIPKSLPEALMAYAKTLQEVEMLEEKIEQDAPKVRFAERVGSVKIGIPVGQYAKMLNQSGFETGEKRFFELLRQDGFLHKEGRQRNMPTQKSIALGVIHIKEGMTINKHSGRIIPNTTPLITGKGQTFFAEYYLRDVVRAKPSLPTASPIQ